MTDELRAQVRDRYAAAALAVTEGRSGGCCDHRAVATVSCCGPTETDVISGEAFGAGLYSTAERSELPEEALLASLGCGNPTAVADLHPGERVLDLGSGGGIDVLLSACRVGPTGRARVLAKGGRIGVSDVVADDDLSAADRAERGSYVGCIAGALSHSEYVSGLTAAGFAEASVEFTHEAAPGMHGAIVRATKPRERPDTPTG